MDAMELLLGRESALKLASPGPSQDDLDVMFQSALRAPDHGRLRPWRFVVVPEDKRELIVLSRFQGLSYGQIGDLVGCETGTVKVRVFRAMKEMGRIYSDLQKEKAS